MFKVAIPTYNRLEILKSKVLVFLDSINIEQARIYIFIDPRSFDEYSRDIDLMTSNYNLIESAETLTGQRNFIRKYFNQGEKLLICDDDLISLDSGSLSIMDEIIYTFELMKAKKLLLGGFNPTSNPFFRSNTIKEGHYFVVGCCYCEINSWNRNFYLKKDEDEKEDYLRTILHLRFRGRTLRNDKVSIVHRSLSESMGGLDIQTRSLEKEKALKRILNKYSYLLNTRKKKEGLELQFKNTMKRVYLKYDYNFEIENGDYPDLTAYLYEIPDSSDWEGYDGEKLVFRIIRNVFKWKDIKMTPIALYLQGMSKLSTQRGDLAGKLDKNKLERWAKKRLEEIGDNLRLNPTGTTTHKTHGFSFSNPIRSMTLHETSQHYKKLIKDDIGKDAIESITKQLDNLYKEYLLIPEEYPQKKEFLDSNFSQIIFNYSTQTATHKDSKNSFDYSIMTTWGEYSGYEFVLPDYNTLMNVHAGDIIIFDGKNTRHSNMEGWGERVSIVGYSK